MWKCLLLSLFGFIVPTALAEEKNSDLAKLKDSLAKWETVKKNCQGNYEYSVTWRSFTGFGHSTTVKVKNNEVVERSYYELGRPLADCGKDPNAPVWVETAKAEDLNTNHGGAPAVPLDDLYEKAKEICTKELKPNEKRTLTFDKRGILSGCFIVDTRIVDDVPRVGVEPLELTISKK